jgi:hypothetical protein
MINYFNRFELIDEMTYRFEKVLSQKSEVMTLSLDEEKEELQNYISTLEQIINDKKDYLLMVANIELISKEDSPKYKSEISQRNLELEMLYEDIMSLIKLLEKEIQKLNNM